MQSSSFKNALDKFKDGANSMEEVYKDLSYLTKNYDKEIEKLSKELDNERTRANNEEHIRHEAEKNLNDIKKLQEINFSVIVEGLIQKPKERFEDGIKNGLMRFIFTIIIVTILSIAAIIYTFYYAKTNRTIQTVKSDNTEVIKLINEIKEENKQLKELISKMNLPKEEMKVVALPKKEEFIEKKVEEKKEDEVIIINKPIEEEELVVKELVPSKNKDQLLEDILSVMMDYDNKFKLNSKNDSRIIYKMFLLDLSPFEHDIIIDEFKLFAKKGTYVPSKEDLKIWDEQMLLIYTNMYEKIKNLKESEITANMRTFHNYKKNDATVYSGWEYIGNSESSTKESLEKEIQKLKTQIQLNSK